MYINHPDAGLDFDFVEAYDDTPVAGDDRLLPENTAPSAINCAFVGVGGGGGKMAKAFLDLGFNKTLLVITAPIFLSFFKDEIMCCRNPKSRLLFGGGP